MTITATEFKSNFGYYLEMLSLEDIIITKNGKDYARVSGINNQKIEQMKGMLSQYVDDPYSVDKSTLREAGMSKYENNN